MGLFGADGWVAAGWQSPQLLLDRLNGRWQLMQCPSLGGPQAPLWLRGSVSR